VRVLLRGMSGSGTSTLVSALVDRGHRAVDLDDRELSEYRVLGEDEVPPGVEPGRDWVWREEWVALLRSTGEAPLFLAGRAPNQGRFRGELDPVVLLTAPVEMTLERLAARSTNPFGKRPKERAKDKDAIEPLLLAAADLVVETTEAVETRCVSSNSSPASPGTAPACRARGEASRPCRIRALLTLGDGFVVGGRPVTKVGGSMRGQALPIVPGRVVGVPL
jgi:hypothetical protein